MSHGTVHDDGGSEDGYGARRADKLGVIRRFNGKLYLFINRRRGFPGKLISKYRFKEGDTAFFHVDRDEKRIELGTASGLLRFNLLKIYYAIIGLFGIKHG